MISVGSRSQSCSHLSRENLKKIPKTILTVSKVNKSDIPISNISLLFLTSVSKKSAKLSGLISSVHVSAMT